MRAGEEFSSYTISTHSNKNNNSSCSFDDTLKKSQDRIMDDKLSSLSLGVSSPSLLMLTTTSAAASSSIHSRDSAASSSSSVSSSHSHSSSSSGARRVAFDHVDIIELAVELGDHPYCTTGPAVQTSGFVERRVLVDLHDYESQRSPLRRSAPQLYLSSEDRMKLLHLDVSLSSPIQSLIPSSLPAASTSSTSSSSSSSLKKYHATEERMLEVAKRVDSLLQRMEVLDQSMARMGRRRQQRQRARRAALVVSRTNRRHSTSSCCGLESSR